MAPLEQQIEGIKGILTSPDILTFEFVSEGGKRFAVIYADSIVDKELLGELVVKPLRAAERGDGAEKIKLLLASPELKDGGTRDDAVKEISDGNAVLLIDGEQEHFVIGLKNPPGRTVAEPPTQIAVKGPREGFTEDIKVNCGLIRKRIKTPALQIKNIKIGKQSETNVALCYIEGIAREEVVKGVERELGEHAIDLVADSSYIARLTADKPRSLFKRWSTCEKPDIFCAKLCEGRVGVVVDGSPLALTMPYMITEDFQAAEDYYICPYRATIVRLIRYFSVVIGVLLPALYISAQLFKIQLIPLKLLLKISGSVSGIPLSPSIEMFLTLFVLEVLNEASIRMPKYVGLALSVVGALVLGDTAVKAGVISTPAIIIVAFSAICLYTVPDLVENTSVLRWLFLVVAGSVGTFGVILSVAYAICYLVSEQSYGVPMLAPYSPLIMRDLKDSALKKSMFSLSKRPAALGPKNKTRLSAARKEEKNDG